MNEEKKRSCRDTVIVVTGLSKQHCTAAGEIFFFHIASAAKQERTAEIMSNEMSKQSAARVTDISGTWRRPTSQLYVLGRLS